MTEDLVPTNRLLGALLKADYASLEPHLRRRAGEPGEMVQRPGSQIYEVRFPLSCVISILTKMDAAPDVEIAMVGNEGLIGLNVALGGTHMNSRELAAVQVPGEMVAIDANRFRNELDRSPALSSLIKSYTRGFMSQIAQQVVCHCLHAIEQRCVRWLLLAHDRVIGDEFPMTQERLAHMLGVRRASVTVTTGTLRRAGLIEFRRGQIRITDRVGLEACACDCYAVTQDVFDHILPY